MPRPHNLIPTYALYKQSGHGRLIWTDTAGVRHEKLFPGDYGSDESLEAACLGLELATSPTATVAARNAISLAELLCAYLEHAQSHYLSPDGRPTKELENMKVVVRALREPYPDLPAAEFGPQNPGQSASA